METLFTRENTVIIGKHAAIMQRLCRDRGGDQNTSLIIKDVRGRDTQIDLFKDRINCFLVAAMLGVINNKTAEPDTQSEQSNVDTTIFANMFDPRKYGDYVSRIYEHIILSEDSGGADEKVRKAFTLETQADVKEAERKILCYVRGGLEILDEHFNSERCSTYEDVSIEIISLVNSVNDFIN